MRLFLFSCLMFCFTLGAMAPEAEARRMGGGSSFGKSFSAPKKVKPAAAPKQDKAANPSATNSAAGAAKKSAMGGLMGGLLAGGLLAALFFGGAFDGIQLMDIVLLGILAFVAIKMFKAMRGSPQPAPSYAGAGSGATPEPANTTEHFTPVSVASTQLAEPELALPGWFNKQAFLEGANGHFTRLQTAWDKQDWQEIATYTTTEMLEQLKAERAKYPAEQITEVVSVMSELINFIDNQDHVVASIHFYGWIKEEASQSPAEFSEIWHLSRDMSVENAHWYIVGIEQPS